MWINSKEQQPTLIKEGCSAASVPVLGVVYGSIRVVAYEQWDDDSPPQWYSCCSEHWNLDDEVSHWMPLPELP